MSDHAVLDSGALADLFRGAKRRRFRARRRDTALPFVDLQPRDVVDKLGFSSVEAMWAFLRRNQGPDGTVDLGGGVHAYKRGARTWVIRVPVELQIETPPRTE